MVVIELYLTEEPQFPTYTCNTRLANALRRRASYEYGECAEP
jgi:hypothetical protein